MTNNNDLFYRTGFDDAMRSKRASATKIAEWLATSIVPQVEAMSQVCDQALGKKPTEWDIVKELKKKIAAIAKAPEIENIDSKIELVEMLMKNAKHRYAGADRCADFCWACLQEDAHKEFLEEKKKVLEANC